MASGAAPAHDIGPSRGGTAGRGVPRRHEPRFLLARQGGSAARTSLVAAPALRSRIVTNGRSGPGCRPRYLLRGPRYRPNDAPADGPYPIGYPAGATMARE